MAEETGIAWCDHTHNEWIGCTKKSEECKFCYAEVLMDHRFGRVKWGPKGARSLTSKANRRKPYAWNKQAAKEGQRRRVFCSSLSDVFEERPELVPWRKGLFDKIRETTFLDWQLLTKRPEFIPEMLPEDWGDSWSNVWLGTSAGTQARWDERVPLLHAVPAPVRFISIEPMIGPIDVRPMLEKYGMSWIIVGGESGDKARPMALEWAEDIRDACRDYNVKFFFKQKGTMLAKEMGCDHKKGENPEEWPEDLRIREFPMSVVG